MTVRELINVLTSFEEGWGGDLKVLDKHEISVRGARIVETKDGPKVKLG